MANHVFQPSCGMMPCVTRPVQRGRRIRPIRATLPPIRRPFATRAVAAGAIGGINTLACGDLLRIVRTHHAGARQRLHAVRLSLAGRKAQCDEAQRHTRHLPRAAALLRVIHVFISAIRTASSPEGAKRLIHGSRPFAGYGARCTNDTIPEMIQHPVRPAASSPARVPWKRTPEITRLVESLGPLAGGELFVGTASDKQQDVQWAATGFCTTCYPRVN